MIKWLGAHQWRNMMLKTTDQMNQFIWTPFWTPNWWRSAETMFLSGLFRGPCTNNRHLADQNLRFKKRPAALITVEKRWACTPCKPRDALRLSPGHYLGGSNSTNQINFKENKHTLLWIQPYHLRKYDSCDDWGLVKSLRKYLDPQGS